MRRKVALVLMASATVLLFGCGSKKGDGASEVLDKGQVIATVDDQDVTVYELNNELQGASFKDAAQRKEAEKAVLQQIISRKILADIARERGLDKSPNYLLQERKADDLLLVNLLRGSIASKIGTPSRSEASAFMDAHPDMFAQRKIYSIDQLRFAPPMDAAKLEELKPMKTLEEIQQWLGRNGIEYQRTPSALDSAKADPSVVDRIAKLPSGEIFVLPGSGQIIVNQITQVRTEPFTGEPAINLAMRFVQGQRLADAARKDLDKLVDDRRNKVKYQPGYAPPKPAKPASGAAAPAQ